MYRRSKSNIICSSICLLISLVRLFNATNGLSTLAKGILALNLIWFTLSWTNYLTNGKLTRWLDDADDDEDDTDVATLEIPPDFTAFTLKQKVSPGLTLLLTHLLEGGDVHEDGLPDVDELKIETANDALAVCAALRQAMREHPEAIEGILGLFWRIGARTPYQIFDKLATPLVLQCLKDVATDPGKEGNDDIIKHCISLLVNFGHQPAFPLLHSLSRELPVADRYWWGRVFGGISADDADGRRLLEMWKGSLPDHFACVTFLDWGNEAVQSGDLKEHPFDTPQGLQRLEGYLRDTDPEHYSYAGSATVALALLRDTPCGLLDLATGHPDPAIRVEAAWARAKRGEAAGFDGLARLCLDWRTRARAVRFLKELDAGDHVPAEAADPRSLAMGEMADWLQHPNELAKLPDSLEIVDHREIHWPPAEKRLPVTLIKWKLGDDEGVGMTGWGTWCFFDTEMNGWPPLDIYAKHCAWELERHDWNQPPPPKVGEEGGKRLLMEANPEEDWTPRP